MNIRSKVIVLSLFALLIMCVYVDVHYAVAQTNAGQSSLAAANNVIDQAFYSVLAAEKAGANVTRLIDKLNGAVNLLSEAENAYRNGNIKVVEEKADAAVLIARQVTLEAQNAKEEAQNSANNSFWFTLALTINSLIVLFLVLFIIWLFIKRRYMRNMVKLKPEVITDEP
jgi:hypothetical protein